MSMALYRKYRSRSLDDVVGQGHVTALLERAIAQGKTAHAYLFTGPKGVGKTSIARILAHRINDLPYDDESTHLDIIEIDAASNNGVEDIRDLRERVQIAPVSAKKKVYIVDEVHMLSKPAFNALLKTLEEPPEHVVFILATTDIDKVPETIISRTQRYSFRRASEADIVQNLKRIAQGEGVSADEQALQLVARHSDGSFRDSVSLFDQLVAGAEGSEISVQDVSSSLGLVSNETVTSLLEATDSGDLKRINRLLSELESHGVSPRTTAAQLADRLRDMLADNPTRAELLSQLLDIGKSPYPELKLLTVLSLHAPVAPSAPPRAEAVPAPDTVPASQVQKEVTIQPAESDNDDTPAPVQAPKQPSPKAKKTAPGAELDWNALMNHMRSHHVALHSVLSKVEPEVDGDTLRLYAKSGFYKKKLDDPKYRALLNDSLLQQGLTFEIETLATAKPPKDGHAAKVAAIMGGGEEVSVD